MFGNKWRKRALDEMNEHLEDLKTALDASIANYQDILDYLKLLEVWSKLEDRVTDLEEEVNDLKRTINKLKSKDEEL